VTRPMANEKSPSHMHSGDGKSAAAIYASVLISELFQLRLSDFLDG